MRLFFFDKNKALRKIISSSLYAEFDYSAVSYFDINGDLLLKFVHKYDAGGATSFSSFFYYNKKVLAYDVIIFSESINNAGFLRLRNFTSKQVYTYMDLQIITPSIKKQFKYWQINYGFTTSSLAYARYKKEAIKLYQSKEKFNNFIKKKKAIYPTSPVLNKNCYVMANHINVRQKPGLNEKIVGQINSSKFNFNTQCLITAIGPEESIEPYGRYKWYKVRYYLKNSAIYDDVNKRRLKQGWVFGAFLANIPEFQDNGRISDTEIN